MIVKRFHYVLPKQGQATVISKNPKGNSGLRASPDSYDPSAAEIWSGINGTNTAPTIDQTRNDYLQHPMYTPLPKPYVGIGPLKYPLKFPEFDQKTLSSQASGLPCPGAWRFVPFDDSKSSPIGDYPHIQPQFTQLKDPHKYWDKQGRRNYGDILYDHDNFTDYLSIGPEIDWRLPFMGMLKTFGLIGLGVGLVALWDPKSHVWFAEKEYPYGGLRVALGGDPNDDNDNWMAAVGFPNK